MIVPSDCHNINLKETSYKAKKKKIITIMQIKEMKRKVKMEIWRRY